MPHLGKAIKNALNNEKNHPLIIGQNYVEKEGLPTNIVDVAAVRAVIDWDKESELKVAPHLPKEALDYGNFVFYLTVVLHKIYFFTPKLKGREFVQNRWVWV